MFAILLLGLGAAIAVVGLLTKGPHLATYAWRGPLFESPEDIWSGGGYGGWNTNEAQIFIPYDWFANCTATAYGALTVGEYTAILAPSLADYVVVAAAIVIVFFAMLQMTGMRVSR